MGHDHDHSHSLDRTAANKRKIIWVLALTTSYLIAEVIGGFLTKSLALLADAGHMLTDVAGLGFALIGMKLAERPATPERTYGYHRAEILAALANAVLLIGISFYVLYEAYERFQNPPKVASQGMLAVATIGLIVNIVGMIILKKGSKDSLNLKGAYFEVVSDALTSVGVILAAIIMWTTGWYYADPIISAGIGLFILPRTWALLKEAVGILLEGTPAHINLAAVREAISKVEGVKDVHDLHVWTLTSGVHALSVHVVLSDCIVHNQVLTAVHKCVAAEFNIQHATVQLEAEGYEETETHI